MKLFEQSPFAPRLFSSRSPAGLTFAFGGNVYVHRQAHFADAALMGQRLSYLW
jgi:hypothetical protein